MRTIDQYSLPKTYAEAAAIVGRPSELTSESSMRKTTALLGVPGSRVRRLALRRMLTTTPPTRP